MSEGSAKIYAICSVDGSRLYKSEHPKYNYVFSLMKNGRVDVDRFNAVFDDSLDLRYLDESVYRSHGGEMLGRHIFFKKNGDLQGTSAIINVTFDYALKEYEHRGNGIYYDPAVNSGEIELKDHVCLGSGGELLAIEVINQKSRDKANYSPVISPIDGETLGELFYYDSGAYRLKKSERTDKNTGKKLASESRIGTDVSKADIRKYLYENGFTVDGIHYVRYKRSAGSGRDGSCLFIAEPLYRDMMEWSGCGIDGGRVSDRASWQAYISLTLSSIIDVVGLPKGSIMLIPDAEAKGIDRVVSIARGGEKNGSTVTLCGEEAEVEYSNKIWDGEALLDESVFSQLEEKRNDGVKRGMMLLRNRMFKTCAFRTRLQKYFADQGIKKVSELGGYAPYAKRVEDIRLVVTESSVKYVKLARSVDPTLTLEDAFKRWINVIYAKKGGERFGIVKQDKSSGPMNNTCAYTNYQLINTLELDRDGIGELLRDSLELLHNIQRDPTYLRYQSRILASTASVGDEDGVYEADANYRFSLIRELLKRSDDAFRLPIYKDYRKDLTDSFKKRLKMGRLIVEGNYETLFGNPLEFLKRTVDRNYSAQEPLALSDGEIYTPRFKDGETLLCARSPHITMGNVLVARNKYVPEIDRYFCLGDSRTIVCVNAIKSNLQQRLNGCDYDSDTMLITNDRTLLSAAMGHAGRFPVPYCGMSETDTGEGNGDGTPSELYDLDIKISENRIGEIVNLSQFLNCLYWDKASKGATDSELKDIYSDICQLAVLSGIEIDRAKRDMKVSAGAVLDALRGRKKEYVNREENGGLPRFFVEITGGERGRVSAKASMNAPLSYIYDAVNADDGRNTKEEKKKYTEFFDVKKPIPYDQGASRRAKAFLKLADGLHSDITQSNMARKRNGSRRHVEMVENMLSKALIDAKKHLRSDSEYYYALSELDEDASDNRRNLTAVYLLCYAKDGYLLNKIAVCAEPMKDLIQDDTALGEEGTVMIYGHPHRLIAFNDN